MRIFKYRAFRQWAKSEKLSDSALTKAVNEMQKGLFDANLGAGLYKKRVAKKGQGKSGSYRTILAFKHENRAVFMYGFAKNERDNLTSTEEKVYKRLAKEFLSMTNQQISTLLTNGELFEVKYEEIKDDKKAKKR
jgi:hypothetical protein